MIRNVACQDAEEICRIYNYYVKNTIVSFEEIPVDAAEIINRIEAITQKFPWLVYETNKKVVGYAYASAWKQRAAYRFSVESTIYVHPDWTGRKIGYLLYERLIAALKQMSLHAVIGTIALPNDASVALHERLGFEKVAHFKEVGRKFDKWIDVGYWQLLI
ncbi:MAG: N-acetyltransferase [Deltaproteobacteria bacterium]|nr:N-acetyltransferase [Deltaproteobacteria bacterium]MBW1961706.1 N-acetyltransferase [Deltaproteobacteria bacterium]MBW2151024.1 N-acetyltransferase [Deltaproteobacteria bacterium]